MQRERDSDDFLGVPVHTQHIPDLDGGAEGGQRVPLLAEQDPTHWPQGCLAEVLDYEDCDVPNTSGMNIK